MLGKRRSTRPNCSRGKRASRSEGAASTPAVFPRGGRAPVPGGARPAHLADDKEVHGHSLQHAWPLHLHSHLRQEGARLQRGEHEWRCTRAPQLLLLQAVLPLPRCAAPARRAPARPWRAGTPCTPGPGWRRRWAPGSARCRPPAGELVHTEWPQRSGEAHGRLPRCAWHAAMVGRVLSWQHSAAAPA